MNSNSEETLLRLPQVMGRTALKRSAIYALVKAGRFPPPIKLSERCSAWPASEVATWIASRIAAGRAS